MKLIVWLALLAVAISGCKHRGLPGPEPVAPGKPAGVAEAKPSYLPMVSDRPYHPTGTEWGLVDDPDYPSVVQRVVGMATDPELRAMASRRGLSVLSLMWEDTARYHASALGPNITDLTLQVVYFDPASSREQTALMPVFRFPNYLDRTGDVPANRVLVRVGNQHPSRLLETVPLTEVLRDLRRYVSRPDRILGSGNLLSSRDTHFLVSAQAVFLPIPRGGRAEFNPVVYNYQSRPGAPAVLVLLATRQGTSMTVIENRPEEQSRAGWGQELYFNRGGERASFVAERHSDVRARIEAQGGPRTEDERSALARGADVLFLVQVPLRVVSPRPPLQVPASVDEAQSPKVSASEAPHSAPVERERRSDVEAAVLGHGRERGPYDEGRGLWLERDHRYPIRITVQFYKATSNGVASERDLDAIARCLGSVYEHADFVGSLVIPEGDPRRPTDWQRLPADWFPW